MSSVQTAVPDGAIAIVGGGIGGVSLAIGLRHRALGPNAISALELLDPAAAEVFHKLATKNAFSSEEATWINFRKGMGEAELIAKVETKDERQTGLSSIHRARFLNALASLIPRDMVRFRKRLVKIQETEGKHVLLHFDDSSQVSAAYVVGCDGIRSCVRQYVLGLENPLDNVTYTRKYVYRGLVPMKTAVERLGAELASNSQMYLGPNGHVLTYPIDGGKTMNVVAFRDDLNNKSWSHANWVLKHRGDNMRREFEGWGRPVTTIVKMLEQPDQWALFNHEPAPCYQKGPVVLLGDAAHATTPHQGAGAGQAVEDALFLAELLGKAKSHGWGFMNAFKVYDAVRRPRSQLVVATSRTAGDTYAMRGLAGSDSDLLQAELLHRFDWIWEYNIRGALDDAIARLQGEAAGKPAIGLLRKLLKELRMRLQTGLVSEDRRLFGGWSFSWHKS
ncbi:putative salicylate hydroxylase [Westerdykella ornata]|uniref:Putative salicylate hydroxylase n=1 Tax=Westerdykella ornata TaxID=318751 RepID=A0A6A6JLF4_WESOR|nr:putative salicylate hydroxylase [Westerdykella ornata]KAF2276778.1 putative salicylate hydroxylase [Westerdykella ornata]